MLKAEVFSSLLKRTWRAGGETEGGLLSLGKRASSFEGKKRGRKIIYAHELN